MFIKCEPKQTRHTRVHAWPSCRQISALNSVSCTQLPDKIHFDERRAHANLIGFQPVRIDLGIVFFKLYWLDFGQRAAAWCFPVLGGFCWYRPAVAPIVPIISSWRHRRRSCESGGATQSIHPGTHFSKNDTNSKTPELQRPDRGIRCVVVVPNKSSTTTKRKKQSPRTIHLILSGRVNAGIQTHNDKEGRTLPAFRPQEGITCLRRRGVLLQNQLSKSRNCYKNEWR